MVSAVVLQLAFGIVTWRAIPFIVGEFFLAIVARTGPMHPGINVLQVYIPASALELAEFHDEPALSQATSCYCQLVLVTSHHSASK
jgi:hypothetical protein